MPVSTLKGQYHQFVSLGGPVLLKLSFYAKKLLINVSGCVWLQMVRMEMNAHLKTSGRFFQVFALMSR